MAYLIVKSSGSPPRHVELTHDSLSIGALHENQLTLDSPFVSRHHARVRWSKGRHEIVDVKSRNGTVVNGHRLEHFKPRPLQNGDEIRIDRFEIAYIAVDSYRGTLDQASVMEGQLFVDSDAKDVWIESQRLPSLSALEFRLVDFLYQNRDRVCSRQEMGRHVWGVDVVDGELVEHSDPRMLDQLIHRLRSEIEPHESNSTYLTNHRGLGYRLHELPQPTKRPIESKQVVS